MQIRTHEKKTVAKELCAYMTTPNVTILSFLNRIYGKAFAVSLSLSLHLEFFSLSRSLSVGDDLLSSYVACWEGKGRPHAVTNQFFFSSSLPPLFLGFELCL